MKKTLFIFSSLTLLSCSEKKNETVSPQQSISEIQHSLISTMPECGDKAIKEKAIIEFKSQIKDVLKNEYFEKNINSNDILEYSSSNNLNYQDVLEKEKGKIENSANQYADNILNSTELKNILTDKLDKDIKKCHCSAEIFNPSLIEGITISYTAQYSEDGILNVILDYSTPH